MKTTITKPPSSISRSVNAAVRLAEAHGISPNAVAVGREKWHALFEHCACDELNEIKDCIPLEEFYFNGLLVLRHDLPGIAVFCFE